MAKRLNCENCIYLNMHKKETTENGYNYRYGCEKQESGYIPFWLVHNRHDIELITGGCSDCNRIGMGTLFKLKSEEHLYTILYCGKVNGEYLLYNQNLKTFKLVEKEWLSKRINRIQFCKCEETKMNTKEDKIRFRRKIAKAKKERYMREYDCNRN